MNEIFALAPNRPPTQEAEGLPRWRWSTGEIERMAAAGYFHEYDRFELLGGEIVPMSPKGRRHERVREELSFRFTKLAPQNVFVAQEPQFNLNEDTYTVPDIVVRPAPGETYLLRAVDALLVVEVAETSLSYDLRTKASLYALHGVREYWVINAANLMTTVHRQPSGNRFASIHEFLPDAELVPELVPELGVTLRTLLSD
jgi:Uma2 family endonuclease